MAVPSCDPPFASATALAAALRNRTLSCTEALDACLRQIARHNPQVNAVAILDGAGARERARQADAALARDACRGPLHGVPFTIKDSLAAQGLPTTLGMRALAGHIAREDAPVVARLKAAGGILLGKTNVSAALSDWQTENPLFGRTNNPWNLERTAGGSSGGSAAALAAGFSALDVGSDLGGSIRIPAHFCGVCGFKPTEHRIPQTGQLDPRGRPWRGRILNALGPLARTPEDLGLAFRICAGPDSRDLEVPPVAVQEMPKLELRRLRIAWMPSFPGVLSSTAIASAVETFARELERHASMVKACLPEVDVEAQWALREHLRDLTTAGIFLPESTSHPPTLAEYHEALVRREHFIAGWERFFESWDVFLAPAALTTAFAHGPPGTPQSVNGEQVEYRRLFYPSTLFNCTGHPAAVIPLARDSAGLPIGLQLVGARWQDERLLAIAALLGEIAGPFQRPPGY